MNRKKWFWLSLAILLDLVLVVDLVFMIYHIVMLDLPWIAMLVLIAVGWLFRVVFVSFKEHFKFYKDCISGSSDPENK